MIFALDYHEQIAPSLLLNDRPFSFLLKLLTDEQPPIPAGGGALGHTRGEQLLFLAGGSGRRWQESYSSSSED